ncbi:MAG: hypothetical protein DRJ01_13275 [Bacteroidetes bacterium]|nr:MAG: hypothetical protein DRJ01_13275 [Bacteroidota bacterium]
MYIRSLLPCIQQLYIRTIPFISIIVIISLVVKKSDNYLKAVRKIGFFVITSVAKNPIVLDTVFYYFGKSTKFV